MYDDIFPEKLPKALKPKETLDYFRGTSCLTRNEVIEGNMRLVLYEVAKYDVSLDEKKELIQEGNIGLMKAIDNFDINRGTQFSSFAVRCIQNEILMYFRGNKKYKNVISLEDPIATTKNGESITIFDIQADDSVNIEENYVDSEAIWLLKQLVVSLNSRDSLVLILYFGLFESEPLTQEQIAFRLNISRSYVSRLVNTNLIKLRELMANPPSKRIQKGKKPSSIFQLLKGHNKNVVFQVICSLNEEDRILLHLRGGRDLDHPTPSALWNRDTALKFNNKLLPKIRCLVEEKELEMQCRKSSEELSPLDKYRREKINEIHKLLLNMDFVNAQVSIHEYLRDTGLIAYEDFIVSLIILSVMDKDFTFEAPIRNLVLLNYNYEPDIEKYKEYFYQSLMQDINEAPLYLDIINCFKRLERTDIDTNHLEETYKRVLEKKN